MPLKKEILFFYTLIIVSAGVLIAADHKTIQPTPKKPGTKCSGINHQPGKKKTTLPFNYITEGVFRFKA